MAAGLRLACRPRRALGQRGRYPLALTRSEGTVAPRIVLLGNAAQSLHPVAGQGFNLGLRDAAELAELLAADEADPGDAELLAPFAAARATDRDGVLALPIRWCGCSRNTRAPVAAARRRIAAVRSAAAGQAGAQPRQSGLRWQDPRLARGLPLS